MPAGGSSTKTETKSRLQTRTQLMKGYRNSLRGAVNKDIRRAMTGGGTRLYMYPTDPGFQAPATSQERQSQRKSIANFYRSRRAEEKLLIENAKRAAEYRETMKQVRRKR